MSSEKDQKKEVSSLTFSMFESDEIKFDHDKNNILEAMGIKESDMPMIIEELKAQTKIMEQSGKPAISKHIELIVKMDKPLAWKIVCLFKICGAMTSAGMIQEVMDIPDDMPIAIAKARLIMAIMHKGA